MISKVPSCAVGGLECHSGHNHIYVIEKLGMWWWWSKGGDGGGNNSVMTSIRKPVTQTIKKPLRNVRVISPLYPFFLKLIFLKSSSLPFVLTFLPYVMRTYFVPNPLHAWTHSVLTVRSSDSDFLGICPRSLVRGMEALLSQFSVLFITFFC